MACRWEGKPLPDIAKWADTVPPARPIVRAGLTEFAQLGSRLELRNWIQFLESFNNGQILDHLPLFSPLTTVS